MKIIPPQSSHNITFSLGATNPNNRQAQRRHNSDAPRHHTASLYPQQAHDRRGNANTTLTLHQHKLSIINGTQCVHHLLLFPCRARDFPICLMFPCSGKSSNFISPPGPLCALPSTISELPLRYFGCSSFNSSMRMIYPSQYQLANLQLLLFRNP